MLKSLTFEGGLDELLEIMKEQELTLPEFNIRLKA
jgi:hypothetical protein